MAQLFSTIFKTTIYEIYFVHRSCYSCDRLAIGRFCIQCKGPDTHIAGIGCYIITAGSYTQVLIRACFTTQKKSCIIDAALKYLYWVIKQFFYATPKTRCSRSTKLMGFSITVYLEAGGIFGT